jgi:hypothetical protein
VQSLDPIGISIRCRMVHQGDDHFLLQIGQPLLVDRVRPDQRWEQGLEVFPATESHADVCGQRQRSPVM